MFVDNNKIIAISAASSRPDIAVAGGENAEFQAYTKITWNNGAAISDDVNHW